MKIFVTGTRGIPDIPGGVERHCQQLYPRIANSGHEVLLSRRKPYTKNSCGLKKYNGIKLIDFPTTRHSSLEAIIHTFLSISAARVLKPDIVHIHAIGPSLLAPFARMLGLKVVSTNHGPDYNRGKWGRLAKLVLRLGEYLGGCFSNRTIVISSIISDIVRKRCSIVPVLIPNGVEIPSHTPDDLSDNSLGITSKNYILAVSRIVPEKGLHDLVQAFSNWNYLRGDTKLVIAGDADHESAYSQNLKKIAYENSNIILTGYITGQLLAAVYANARLFVLPSYHEGHPIALLEAMSYGLPVLVSDIPANLEIGLPNENYFQCGNIESLTEGLNRLISKPADSKGEEYMKSLVRLKYNWDKIAEQTIRVYQEVL